MFGSTILEVALSIVFIYLLLSFICSGINEFIMRMVEMRAKLLLSAMQGILKDKALIEAFFAHRLISGLDTQGTPIYIPSRVFALVMRDLANVVPADAVPAGPVDNAVQAAHVASAAAASAGPNAAADNAIASTTAAPTAVAAVILLGAPTAPPVAASTPAPAAATDVQKAARELIDKIYRVNPQEFQKNLENWFDDAMDHVTTWYKRKVQTVNLILGLSVAFFLNADTFMLARFLWFNPAVREQIVQASDDFVKQEEKKAAVKDAKDAQDQKPAATLEEYTKSLQDKAKKIKLVQSQLEEVGVPIGWRFRDDDDKTTFWTHFPEFLSLEGEAAGDVRYVPMHFPGWASKFFGLLVTGLALSLGSPFWFDMLKNLNTLRSTAKPPPREEDRALPAEPT